MKYVVSGTKLILKFILNEFHTKTFLDIDEVWHWPEERRSKNLFKPFIDCFVRMKLCATAFPENIQTDEEKESYVASLSNEYGIEISVSDIRPNPTMYTVAKTILNRYY